MKRLRMYLIAAALMTGGSALANAQPMDHGRYAEHVERGRVRVDDRRYDRPEVRVDHRFFVGERRFFNGYYWTWDGGRWCRRDGRAVFYFNF